MTETVEDLQVVWTKVLDYVQTFGITINKKKSFAFTTDPEVHTNWTATSEAVGGLPVRSTFTYLGVILDVGHHFDEQLGGEFFSKIAAKAKTRLSRVQALPLPLERKTFVAASVSLSSLLFTPFSWHSSQKDMNGWRSSIIKAVQGGLSAKRCSSREIFFYILNKGHVLDPVGARILSALRWLAVFIQHDSQAAIQLQTTVRPTRLSLVQRLSHMLQEAGLSQIRPFQWQDDLGETFDLHQNLVRFHRGKVWHDWRAFWKSHILSLLQKRRPVFAGVLAVDRSATLKYYATMGSHLQKGAARIVFMDALLSKQRLFKEEEAAMCEACEEVDSVEHIYWHCTRWAHLRTVQHGECGDLCEATRMCGLLPPKPSELQRNVQKQLIAIAGAYLAWRVTSVPWPPPPRGAIEEDQDAAVQHAPRVPTHRVRGKTPLIAVRSMPPRPSSLPWIFKNHVGACVRIQGQWKARCNICTVERLWQRRHLVTPCRGEKKGIRDCVRTGFHREYRHGRQRIVCDLCDKAALWEGKSRFEKRHVCRKADDGEVIRAQSWSDKLAEEQVRGFVRHSLLLMEREWCCSVCGLKAARKQALQQTWCKRPEGAPRQMW